MRTISVALPYAVSIRDFVNSGCLSELRGMPDVRIVIHTLNPEIPELDCVRGPNVEVLTIAPYKDGRVEAMLKRFYALFFLDTFVYVRFAIGPRPLRRLFAETLTLARRLVGTRRFLRWYGATLLMLYRRRAPARQLDPATKLFIGTRSLINSLDYGLLAEATSLGIPVLTLSGSWDNFTTKGFFPFPARRIVVWNEKMKRELRELFGVPGEQVAIVGYPRAKLLRESVTGDSAADYLREIGIDGYRGFVLYAASYGELTRPPDGGVPYEYRVAKQLTVMLLAELPPDICVLVRLHPFSSEADNAEFANLPRCHVFVPGRSDKYVERVMGRSDERHLAMQIARSVCVVSMASTISIDCLCLERPILNVAYDPIAGLPLDQSIRRFYQFNHFRDLVAIAGLPLAASPADVSEFVRVSMAGGEYRPVNRSQFTELYVPAISRDYSRNVYQVVEALMHE